MSRLSLDFANAQRPLASPRLGLGLALLAAGAIALGVAAWEYREQTLANASLQERRDQLAERVERRRPAALISPEIAAQAEQAGAAYAQLRAPWEEVFHALEAARGAEIALLSLSADAGKREIALSGEARDFAALSAFADTLSASPPFRKATLANHKFSDGAAPIVVKFDLALGWRRPGGEGN
ncbi:MAG: PilN domain-containing protein [Betaproteobacteria bacterium]|nr:PilN domain-containing protein [Betaproteobacteria bacterium]